MRWSAKPRYNAAPSISFSSNSPFMPLLDARFRGHDGGETVSSLHIKIPLILHLKSVLSIPLLGARMEWNVARRRFGVLA